MKQFFVTSSEDETGEKIIKVLSDIQLAINHQMIFMEEIKSDRCFSQDNFFGGIKELYFNDSRRPCTRTWRFLRKNRFLKKDGTDYAHFPRKATKEGKAVQERIDMMFKVPFKELNNCINSLIPYNEVYSVIKNNEYIGIIYDTKWVQHFPNDLYEISISEFKRLFPNFDENDCDRKILCQ